MSKQSYTFPPNHLLNSNQDYDEPYEKDGFIYYDVYQELSRSIRRKASLRIKPLSIGSTLSPQEMQTISQVLKRWKSVKKPLYLESKVPLNEQLLKRGIETHFFAEWLTYESDGHLLLSKFITIGPEGLKWLVRYHQAEQEELARWNDQWLKDLEELKLQVGLSPVYDDLINIALDQQELLKQVREGKRAKERLFFQFLIHLLKLHLGGQTIFDWKEIGSKGFARIGGSKVYDSQKEWLLEQLEKRSRFSLEEIGFISLGQIIPIYYSGILYQNQRLHDAHPLGCITHLQLKSVIEWNSPASFLIITENRSPLVKMALTGWIQHKNGIVICTDGNLKIPHKKLISQLSIDDKPIYGWVDYDPSGLDIADQIMQITSNKPRFVLTTNEKAPTHVGTFHELAEDIEQRKKQRNFIEQEQILGNPKDWDLLFC
ncbi:hypothetical protein BEP19_03240 [Ammoniphilus oxalaticus]|uniref:DUF2399 domain-containing protein n=1 Tax=Ammoniphilus oxalaticus TaxID=66863 RepID=A0A419SNX3_9BACL|nr:DUF2399 domain-containing protein [Ammoniphilus oxalaticus]RKD25953.1 hypothetical protein BEP19_03240 [Ammoniphilus oxalaticus]